MGEVRTVNRRKQRPALDPDARFNQVIGKAVDLAEKRIEEGTATGQEICFFLKMGTSRYQLDQEYAELQNELVRAKTDSLRAAASQEEKYIQAINAMKAYTGSDEDDEEIDDEEELY